MIKQNIKIAILVLIIALGLWAIASAFIKLDYSVKSIINFSSEQSTILVQNDVSAYIENKNIDKVKVEYEKQYFECRITYEAQQSDLTSYIIYLPTIIPRSSPFMETNIIVDSLNIYQYILKK